MKILKTINSSYIYNDDEMKRIVGGMMSNENEASHCKCSGSSDGHIFCSDNTNKAQGCTCTGNNNNENKYTSCSCS